MSDDGAERSLLGRRAGIGVGVARAGGRRGRRCRGDSHESEGGYQAEHCLSSLESPLFSLSDARCASSEPSPGYQASRGFFAALACEYWPAVTAFTLIPESDGN